MVAAAARQVALLDVDTSMLLTIAVKGELVLFDKQDRYMQQAPLG